MTVPAAARGLCCGVVCACRPNRCCAGPGGDKACAGHARAPHLPCTVLDPGVYTACVRSALLLRALPCPALPCPALPCPALPCPALPCPALPCPALPAPIDFVLYRDATSSFPHPPFRLSRAPQETIQEFKPSPADIDYPLLLQQHYLKARERRRAAGAGPVGAPGVAAGGDASTVSLYDTWFPTLRQTLLCLSKIYRCVEVGVCLL